MDEAEKLDGSIDVLSMADAFIHRRRAQIGGAAPVDTPQVEPVDDIPLLTEVVIEASLPAIPASAEVATQRDISAEVARELDVWLDENLPQVVVHVMDGITDKLIQQVLDSAREDLVPRLKRMLSDDIDPGKQ